MNADKPTETTARASGQADADATNAERDKPRTWLGRVYRRLKRAYDAFDDASSLLDFWELIKSQAQNLVAVAKANTAATAAAATVATTATVVAIEPELLTDLFEDEPPAVVEPAPAPVPEPPVEIAEPPAVRVETIRWGEAVVFPIEGVDAEGRRARFEVAVLPTDFAWARSSAVALTRDGEPLDADAVETIVFAAPLRAGLAQSEALIAVGAASQEGDLRAETIRARNRARTAAGWLREYVSEEARIYTLNLGQYQPSCGADASEGASWQRPVLFIGVREAEDAIDLRGALVDAMADKSNLPDSECYSAFTLEATNPPPR